MALIRAALAALVGLVLAHGATAAPARQSVVQSVEIAAPPAKVWEIVKNFADLSWHPAVKASSANHGNRRGSVRTLDLGGPKLVEQLAWYSPSKTSYGYRITADPANVATVPVTRYRSTIAVRPGTGGGSTVTWSGTFSRADPSAQPAAGRDDAAAVAAVTGIYRAGLDHLKALAEKAAG